MPKTAKKPEGAIELVPMNLKYATVTIVGDGDIVLNKMNASNTRALLADDRKTQAIWEAQHANKWENIITSIHWRDGIPVKGDNSDGLATNRECSEEMMREMLENNAPCITVFGLLKSWGQSVVRNELDKNSTKFNNAINIVSKGGLVPIKFAEWNLDERIMSPQRGSPVTIRLNHFSGWSADIQICYTTHVFSDSEIVNIINYAGFGLGIGSGRSSGYGRYHVENVV